jgi:hypothetical protein
MEEMILSRQELYDLVWSESMLALSKHYEISDVGLRKMCKRLEIPLPKAGHWAKIQAGKKVKKEKLTPNNTVEQKVSLRLRKTGDESRSFPSSPFYALKKEIQEDKRVNLAVPERMTNPDPLVIKAKRSLAEKHKSWKFEGMIHTENGNLDIRVSPALVNRALRFMDTFIKASRARGHEILVDSAGTYVIVKEQKIKIGCKEISKRIVVKDGNWERSEYHPTGLLGFKSEGYSSGEWRDTKKLVDEQIPSILAKLEISIQGLLDCWEENRKREEIRKEKERIAKELVQRQEDELANFKAILQDASRLHQATAIRNYLDKVEALSIKNNTLTDELVHWLAWARKKADWYDPLIESEDELLHEVDRNTLALKKKEWWP